MMSHALYTAIELRQLEQHYEVIQGDFYLMQKAAQAIQEFVCQRHPLPQSQPLFILAGPGNNGGDALLAASLLAPLGYRIHLIYCTPTPDPLSAYQGPARLAWQALVASQLNSAGAIQVQHVREFCRELPTTPAPYCVIIDGLFGLGLQRPIQGDLAQLVQYCNQLAAELAIPMLALDVPSGVNSDSGAIMATPKTAPAAVIRATTTLSFLADKPGLHTAAALDYTGEIQIANLGVTADSFPEARHYLLDAHYPYQLPAARLRNSHKGSFGDVILIGGAQGMQGALLLAARAAKLAGSGRIFAGFLDLAPAFDPLYPELMCRSASELDFHDAIVVLGPGLGQSSAAQQLCARVFAQAHSVVVDADALNCLASQSALREVWQNKTKQARLLTPHPLEAARLLASSTQEIQQNRFSALEQLCHTYQASVILKGAGSLIAAPESPCFINSSGNPLLASGGSGDILSGLCGALLAQGLPPLEAAKLACYVHGAAADRLKQQHPGWLACSSTELLQACRETLADLLYDLGEA